MIWRAWWKTCQLAMKPELELQGAYNYAYKLPGPVFLIEPQQHIPQINLKIGIGACLRPNIVPSTQRAQDSFIKKYTLNHIMDP